MNCNANPLPSVLVGSSQIRGEALIKYDSVIASAAKQSMAHARSATCGSPRPYGTRDDGLEQDGDVVPD